MNGPIRPVAFIPLSLLCLCVDCEACFVLGPARCPACASGAWVLLAARPGEFLARAAREQGAAS